MKKILTFCLVLVAGHAIASSKSAEAFVQKLSDDVFSIMQSNSSEQKKETQLRSLFNRYVDTKHMGRTVLDDVLNNATPEQTDRYLSLYKEYLTYSYVPKFKTYTGTGLEIVSVTPEVSGAYIVATKLDHAGDTLNVDYLIKKSKHSYQLIDIIGEGVSVVQTQQSDFGAYAQRKGLDHFLKMLEKKVAKLK